MCSSIALLLRPQAVPRTLSPVSVALLVKIVLWNPIYVDVVERETGHVWKVLDVLCNSGNGDEYRKTSVEVRPGEIAGSVSGVVAYKNGIVDGRGEIRNPTLVLLMLLLTCLPPHLLFMFVVTVRSGVWEEGKRV